MENGKYRARLLIALSALRKICNHPDLYLYTSPIVKFEFYIIYCNIIYIIHYI